MQTSNLTWEQAKNFLYSGRCKRVRYDPNRCNWGNSFMLVDGVINRVFDSGGKIKPGMPEDTGLFKKFIIVE